MRVNKGPQHLRDEIARQRAEIERLSAMHRDMCVVAGNQVARIERLKALLERWVNIAEHGQYGDRTKYPLRAHPIADETRAALAGKEG